MHLEGFIKNDRGLGNKQSFRFEPFWLCSYKCIEVISEAWLGGSYTGNAIFDLRSKLESVSSNLNTWSNCEFGFLGKAIKKL